MVFRLLVGLIGLCLTLYGTYVVVTFFKDKERPYDLINGEVLYMKRDNSGEGGPSFYPVIEYEYNGETRRTEGRTGNSKLKGFSFVPGDKYTVGDSVELRVYKGRKIKAVINEDAEINSSLYGGIIIIAIGAGNIFMAIFA